MIYNVSNKTELELVLKEAINKDVINIHSLECLGMSIYSITDVLNKINNKGICLKIESDIVLDFSKNDTSLKSSLLLLNSICELQKNTVRQSVKKAKEEGKILGRKKLEKEDLPDVFLENLKDFQENRITKVEFAKKCNCSRPTLYKWLKCISEYN